MAGTMIDPLVEGRTSQWHSQVDRNPMLLVGAALGGGILIGAMISNARHKKNSYAPIGRGGALGLTGGELTGEARQQATTTVDQIKAALIAFGITKVKEYLSQAMPGLEQHLKEAEQRFGFGGGDRQTAHSDQPTSPFADTRPKYPDSGTSRPYASEGSFKRESSMAPGDDHPALNL